MLKLKGHVQRILQITDKCPNAFATLNPSSHHEVKGFAELVESCLRRTLDRTEQRTHWEQDSLTQAQLDYAGMHVFAVTYSAYLCLKHFK